jgi:two-component system sensor histidine kinase/response regulator
LRHTKEMLPSTAEFYKFWVKLSGRPSQFPLNARIFHSVCVISIFALSYNIPFNYLVGLPAIALSSFVVLIICAGLYYASRFRQKVAESILITNFVGTTLFIVNFFLNSGINGPTSQFFLLFLLLSIAISPVEQYKFWIPVNIGVVLAVHAVEFFFPETVPFTYMNRESQFIDITSAYVVVALLAYFCTDYIRRSYEQEKSSATEKNKAIVRKNQLITSQNEELKKLNDEKNKLMSIVAHDLRSPLASIQNFLELLSEYDLPAEQKLAIEKELLNSTKQTLVMLSKLLDWSKTQLQGVSAHKEPLDLNDLFTPTLNFEKGIAYRKGIELEYLLDPTITIFADREMMQLIVRNLVGNAIKFTSEGGTIAIGSEVRDNNCVISIRDNGIGIPADKQDAIFSLNVQSTFGTKNEKGVGLGLLLCQEFIHAQNGKLWFESTEESGTCFYISIPLHQESILLNNPD